MELEVSARDGCAVCWLRWKQLTYSEKAELQHCTDIRYYFIQVVSGKLEFQLEYFLPNDLDKATVRKAVLCLTESGEFAL